MAVKESYVSVKEVIMKAPAASNAPQTSNIGGFIVAPVGPRIAYITSPAQFLETYTKDGQTVPRNADITFINAYYLSYAAGLVLVRSVNTTAVAGVLFIKGQADPVKVIYKDGSLMTKKSTMTLKLEAGIQSSGGSWSFVMGDTVFYHGVVDKGGVYAEYQNFQECETLLDLSTPLEDLDNVHIASKSESDGTVTFELMHTAAETSEDTFKLSDKSEEKIGFETLEIEEPEDLIEHPESDWLFDIQSDIALDSDEHSVLIKEVVPGKSFTLMLDDEPYNCSLKIEESDENGQNIYIEYINTQGVGFQVTVYNGEQDPTKGSVETKFGKSGLDLKDSASDANLQASLTYLEEQELYDIEYLAPMGITRLPVVKRLQSCASTNKWFCPIDSPTNALTLTSVKRYFNDLAIDAENVPSGIGLGPFDKNSSLTGWVNYIAASTLYWERVMSNKAQSAEFAPVFKNAYGTFNYSNPLKLFKKSEREELLSQGRPINWVVFSQRTNTYYMNDNRTYQTKTDIVSEEQNARLVWKISKDLVKILDQFIGKYNTRSTREEVKNVITYYFNWNIMNQRFPPEAFEIICDETNNTDEMIRNNKLGVEVRVRLYNAIKYIEVINKVFPLGVDFNASLTA